VADEDIPHRKTMTTKVRTRDLKEKKRRGEKIAMLTAYDANMARLLDNAGVDALLVGDSVGMVVLGYDTTIPVTLDAMIHHTAKLEGGHAIVDVVKRLVDVGVPVMGHLGLLPQSVHRVGGFLRQATNPHDADILLADALALEEAGAFAIVLESIPSDVARTVTEALAVPAIGIGAGPDCDGQVLVTNDMIGLFDGPVPSFVKQYAHVAETVTASVQSYVEDVKSGRFARAAASKTPTPTT
jgi:3-methyl-2-oxobutanoate hydroxymethyltransferase